MVVTGEETSKGPLATWLVLTGTCAEDDVWDLTGTFVAGTLTAWAKTEAGA